MKLIIHIGSGKTGTSSIQHSLEHHSEELKRKGVFYAGMYFEQSPFYKSNGLYPHVRFYQEYGKNTDILVKHINEQLDKLIPFCEERDINTIIWSNEALFKSYNKLGELIESLREKVEVQLIAYIRRQDSWLLSAYQQWGIKHKTNPNEILSFDQWYELWKPECDYSNIFNHWAEVVGQDNVTIRIYELTDDVVSDFYQTCKLGIDVIARPRSDNKALKNTHASLYKLFNTHFKDHKPPHALGGFLNRTGVSKLNLEQIDASLNYPSADRLAEIQQEFTESNERLNNFSPSGDELEFPQEPMNRTINDSISRDGLISAILFALVNCETRICQLEGKIKDLSTANNLTEKAA